MEVSELPRDFHRGRGSAVVAAFVLSKMRSSVMSRSTRYPLANVREAGDTEKAIESARQRARARDFIATEQYERAEVPIPLRGWLKDDCWDATGSEHEARERRK